jgi:hypothetical protein
MKSDILISPAISYKDLESLLINISFPLTKAEIIHRAEAEGFPLPILWLLRNLPSRFYRSKNEFISQCFSRSIIIKWDQEAIEQEEI